MSSSSSSSSRDANDYVAGAEASSSRGSGSSSSNGYSPPPLGGLIWCAPPGGTATPRCIIWVGPPSGPALTHLQLTHSAAAWAGIDPADGFKATAGLSDSLSRLLRRRYFLVEKARAASIIGLLVGTLGAAGYLEALEALRKLAGQVGWMMGFEGAG
jgi:diphthamide biosynthesis protein 2